MSHDIPKRALQLRSLIRSTGELELSLAEIEVPTPAPDEVLIRIEAAPINPSDLGLLFGAADMRQATAAGTAERPIVTAPVPQAAMKGMAARLDVSMPVGNEGAGLVVAAGASPAAQALLSRRVAAIAGAMYSQYRCATVDQCLPLAEGASAADGASAFINPLTALGMVETMRHEGHHALVHTAAASNLGQMLNRVCLKDGISLVNIVRKPEQVALLKSIGATHVCDMSQPSFEEDLIAALVATGATIAFDATGGGTLGGQILSCMEVALTRSSKSPAEYSRYGTTTHKQVYLYGGLDTSPTRFNRNFGMAWSMGGWLVFPFLQKIGVERAKALKDRVAAELMSTFKSDYAGTLSLAEVLQLDSIAAYGQRATGAKVLINPSRA